MSNSALDELRRFDPASADAIDRIAAERLRQINGEGWTVEHDDEHAGGEIALAAAAYALAASNNDVAFSGLGKAPFRAERNFGSTSLRYFVWPWDKDWFKPTTTERDLEKSGALVVAEMARCSRRAGIQKAEG